MHVVHVYETVPTVTKRYQSLPTVTGVAPPLHASDEHAQPLYVANGPTMKTGPTRRRKKKTITATNNSWPLLTVTGPAVPGERSLPSLTRTTVARPHYV